LNEQIIFTNLVTASFILAAAIFVLLFFFTAPYGRYTRSDWGPTIDNEKGWVIMESTAPVVFAICFLLGGNPVTAAAIAFLTMWEAHYIHRAFIYPLGLRGQAKRMPIVIMASGFIFNAMNGYLNGRYIFALSDGYANEWLSAPRFIVGMLFFTAGFIINRRADLILRNLRKSGESDYRIPYGEMFRWISCPNYLGEIVIWMGWAVATWSLPGLAFAVWTLANLAPRARAHHAWYRKQFPDYPGERKVLVPGLW